MPDEARASDYVMTFGDYAGKTLFEIACEDPEWLDSAADWVRHPVAKAAILAALKEPEVARRVDSAVF